MKTSLPRRTYDYRIREAICESRDPGLFPELNIPNSTIRSWLQRGVPDVVTSELAGRNHSELLTENRELRRRVALLGAVVGVLASLLRTIARSKKVMPLNAALRIAGLSPFRYHSWRRAADGCDLEDRPSAGSGCADGSKP
jgi:hypothetical protein